LLPAREREIGERSRLSIAQNRRSMPQIIAVKAVTITGRLAIRANLNGCSHRQIVRPSAVA
jgi:hypothetical protein